MTAPSLWQRLRRARIVQVLLVYLGASWAVLQIADTFTEALALPSWVSPVAIILLLVGLVIIVATAWVQSLPSTTAAEQAGERPTDWEIAPADAVASLRRGRLPHLTWGRAIAGGVFALSILFGGAGVYVVLTGGRSFLTQEEAGATDAAEGIAILPFKVNGEGLEVWREGMVDLLATNLDGMGGYRAIDARTVLARWKEIVGDEEAPDLEMALRVAGQTGARYAVVGSAVGVGGTLRLVVDVYDLANGQEIGKGQTEGSTDDVLSMIDDLSLETMRALLAGGGEELATTRNLADLTTSSLPALRAYLEGERQYRRGEFPQAVEAYERAVDEDSTFALALFRISDAYGWLESINSERAIELGARAFEAIDRMTPRNAVIVGAGNALYTSDLTYLERIEAAVRKYPDDPEAWFMLGEMYIHMGEATRARAEDARDVVQKAIDLDPSFAPYYIHAADIAINMGDREAAEHAIETYRTLNEEGNSHPEYQIGLDAYLGDEAEREAALAAFDDLPVNRMGVLWGTFGLQSDEVATSRRIAEYMRARTGQDGWWAGLARLAMAGGRWTQAEAMVRDSLPGGPDPETVYLLHRFARPQPDDLLEVVRSCDFGPSCTLYAGALAAEEGDWARHQAAIDAVTAAAAQLREEGRPITARYAQSTADGLTGYGQLRRGNPAVARVTLDRAQGKSPGVGDRYIRLWLAEVDEALGRPQDAIRWYGLLQFGHLKSHAHYRRARLADEIGESELARTEWQALLLNLAGAQEVDPRPAEARAALARLGG